VLKIVHFLGYSGSGKTSAISLLTKVLTKTGKRVGTLKHVHAESFSIDRKGKDSWVHKKSGASIVIAISSNEFVIMKSRSGKGRRMEDDLKEAFHVFRKDKLDYVFIEGFHNILSKHRLKQVICARNEDEARELLLLHRKAICVLSAADNFGKNHDSLYNTPILRLPTDKSRIIQLIS
jgi:molybdopterin-guanine dinucleotide biosynthesis protein MobB